MDEHEDVSVASDDYVSSLRVSVDGGDETPIGKMGFEGRSGRVEGGESVVDEFGRAFHNAEDIMVEVMGSDVFVDGVCSSGGGGSSDEEEVEAEVGCGVSVETGSVREEKFGGGGVDDLVPREVGDLAGGSETESKGSLVVEQILDGQTQVFVTESRCTHTQVVQEEVEVLMNKEDLEGEVVEGREVVEGGGVVNDDTSLNRFGITDDEVLNPKNETGSKGSLVVEQILDGQTQVFVTESRCTHTQVVQEEVEVLMNKEDLEGREVVEGGGVVNDAMGLNKVGITDYEVLNKNETGVKESSQIVTTMHQETCDVLENVQNLANEKGKGGGLVQQGVGKLVKSADDVVSVLDEKMARESGALDNEVGKSETEAEIVSSTTIVVEFSSVENLVGEGLNPKHEVPNERDQISMTGKVAGKIQDAACVEKESSYEQTQVVDNEVAEIHREEIKTPSKETVAMLYDLHSYYIPYPTGSAPRHSAAAYLDWTIPNVTPTGIVYEQISLPTEQEWDSLPNFQTVTREDFKKSLGLIAGLKKWASNITAKMSYLSVSHDHLQSRVRFFEEQEARRRRHAHSSTTAPGPSGAHAPSGSAHRERILQRSQTSRRPERSQASSRRHRHREDDDVTSSRFESGSRRDPPNP